VENNTGIIPVEYHVIIKVEKVDDKSAGGIFLSEISQEREQMAHDKGWVVAISDMAFSDWNGRIPQPGEKVIFNKYAGSLIKVRNDKKEFEDFRLCNDKDIVAILLKE